GVTTVTEGTACSCSRTCANNSERCLRRGTMPMTSNKVIKQAPATSAGLRPRPRLCWAISDKRASALVWAGFLAGELPALMKLLLLVIAAPHRAARFDNPQTLLQLV